MTTFTTQDRIHAEKDGSFTIDCRLKPLDYQKLCELYLEAKKQSWTMVRIKPDGGMSLHTELEAFARLIEKAHGIR